MLIIISEVAKIHAHFIRNNARVGASSRAPNLDLHALFERIPMLCLEYNQRKKLVQATDSSGHIGINWVVVVRLKPPIPNPRGPTWMGHLQGLKGFFPQRVNLHRCCLGGSPNCKLGMLSSKTTMPVSAQIKTLSSNACGSTRISSHTRLLLC